MQIELTPIQARVIGCLIEKEITTPEQYPLSLNALVNACNQKSNREPVMSLDESTVQNTVDELVRKYLVSDQSGFGSRVTKYKHRFCNSDYGKLQFNPLELAIVCELLLRGPQMPGELRSRASRMAALKDVHEVEELLEGLAKREDGPFVVRLPRQPGRRESRYAHCFSGSIDVTDEGEQSGAPSDSQQASAAVDQEERLASLEQAVRDLQLRLAVLEGRATQAD